MPSTDRISCPPDLRERVLATAKRLGYAGPDPVARSLRTRKAGAVGLVMAEAADLFLQRSRGAGFRRRGGAIVRRAGAGTAAGGRRTQPQPRRRNGRGAGRRGGRLRGVFGLRRRPLPAGGAAAALAGRGGRSAQRPARRLPGGHRRPGGDARARRLRAGLGASRDRVADHAAGPGATRRTWSTPSGCSRRPSTCSANASSACGTR